MKIKLINSKDYFIESEKAVRIAYEREKEVRGTLRAVDKLKIAKESLKNVKTRREHDELTELIKDLEFEVKYSKGAVPAIPEKYQNKIAFNRVHEEEELDKELQKQKELLHELVSKITDPIDTVLKNIKNLEKRKMIGQRIDELLAKEIILDNRIACPSYIVKMYEPHQVENSRQAVEQFSNLNKLLQKIAKEPVKRESMVKPNVITKILGGKK